LNGLSTLLEQEKERMTKEQLLARVRPEAHQLLARAASSQRLAEQCLRELELSLGFEVSDDIDLTETSIEVLARNAGWIS
jgi:hypothetical protein